MKELKPSLWNDLFIGFNEISSLLETYRFNMENLNGKKKEEDMQDFIECQMTILKALCDSHLCKIQSNILISLVELKNEKETYK